jgi:SPP1 gp7 family putative phage head morphogenesis protein
VEELIEEYNERLRDLETVMAAGIAAALDRYFRTLQGRIQIELQSGQSPAAATSTRAVELVPPLLPDESDELLQIFEDLLQQATTSGLALGAELSKPVVSSPVAATIQVAEVVSQARRARRYLEEHSLAFSTAVAGIVAQAIAEQRATAEVIKDIRRRLDVLKSRAEVVVRTESMTAANSATASYYVQNNIKLVVYYATADDRTCPFCIAFAGKVFKLGAVKVPRHPNCRCYLAPYSADVFGKNAAYDKERRKHRKEVLSYARAKGIQPNECPAFFELGSPLPIRTDAQR